MRPPLLRRLARTFATAVMLSFTFFPALARAGEDDAAPGKPQAKDGGWIELIGASGGLDAFPGKHPGWENVAATALKPDDPKHLIGTPGAGVAYNGPVGRASNLVTAQKFGDVEVHVEFMVPKNSNSGIKLEGVYEIQIFDSYGVSKATASHSGGIYPRAELLPTYHHIDDGYPPLVNASLPPGEWQTLDITYRAPRFDASGKKTASARFVKVVLNGRVVQDDVEVPCPTGNNWRNKEQPTGPIFLQGDHGPVAFRNVRVRPL
jgi:Domain of Unknown Function (DUF1080)